MKKTTVSIFGFLAAFGLLGISIPTTFAASGNWNVDAAGNWNTAGNWNPAAVPGTAPGDVVGLTFDITAARTVTLDTAATVGTLNIGDPTSGFFGYTLSTATSQTLTFNNNGSGASLVQATVGGAADTISVPVTLADNLSVSDVNGLTLSGTISSPGTVNLTKSGAGTLTLSGANTFIPGTITINGGTLYCPRSAANNGTSSAFGNISGGGANIFINAGAILSSGNNNWFGNQTLADSSLPTINITGGTLVITNNYSTIGILNLTNGATVTSTGTGSGNYYGFQFRGNVYVGGTSPTTISGSRDYHLNVNTVFDVENSGGSPADLVVSANMRNLSGDFGNAAGALTKTGPGKMMITSGGNVFSGSTTISAGTLQIGDGTANNGSLAGYIDDEATLIFANPTAWTYTNYIVGAGNLIKTGAGTLTLSGTSYYTGSTTISNGVLNFTSPQSISGTMTVNDGKTLAVAAAQDATYLSPSSLTLGNATGATLQFGVVGTTTAPLNPSSLTINGTATINISSCPLANGATYPLINNYSSGTLVLGSQPNAVLGQLIVSGSTVSYQVTNVDWFVWTAAVNTNWDTTTANWTNTLGGNLFVANSLCQFDDSALGASPLSVYITPSAVSPGTVYVTNSAKNYIVGGLGIAGSASITKDGNGTLTLTNVNSFTGPVTILAGTVEIGGPGQLGSGTYSGTISNNSVLSHNSAANQTFSGVISGTGSLVKSNASTLTLSAPNTFSGGVTNFAGTISVTDGNALGSGTLTLNGGKVVNGGSSDLTVGNNIIGTSAGGTITLGVAKNLTLTGTVGGSGSLTLGGPNPLASLNISFSANTFAGTITIPPSTGNNQTVSRFKTISSGSATAAWSIGGAQDRGTTLDFTAPATIEFGSLSGGGIIQNNGSGTRTVQVGALNTDSVFAGSLRDNGATMALTKIGNGKLTLTGSSTTSGGININGGVLSVSNSTALGSSGTLKFGGGTLQYTPVNQADYSARIANSTSNISIDVNGTNVTYATGLAASNAGGLALTNSTGSGKLTLTAANFYTGATLINAGTLALGSSGNIGLSTNIILGSNGVFDVSGVAFTLAGSQTLAGNGSVTGSVATAGSSSTIIPGALGVVGTLSFSNNLNLVSGATLDFDLGTSSASGNDRINVAGNVSLSSSDAFHINFLGGLNTGLDQSADYVLLHVSGITTMAAQPLLVFDGTAPTNSSHYSVQTNNNNVVLHYSVSSAPVILSVVVTNNADGTAVANRGDYVTVYATVQPGFGTITNVHADLTLLGGSASQTLTALGGNHYSYTLQIGPGATVGLDSVGVTAIDTTPLSGSGSATLTVNAAVDTWNGLGSDDNWGTGANWVSTFPPGYMNDNVIFAGSTRLTPNMETNYSVTSLTFDSTAGSFIIGTAAGKTLTLSGGLTNNSSSAQEINVPIQLNTIQNVVDANSVGITLAGPISGLGGLTLPVNGTLLTLAGSNTYAGATTIGVFDVVKIGNASAIPVGPGIGSVSLTGTLDLNGTNAFVNSLNGSGTVDNSGLSPATLTIGYPDGASVVSGVIQNSGASLALVKTGTNVLELDGGNTFGGGITVSNGVLLVGNGSALGSGTTVLAGGTLQNNVNNLTLANNINVTAPSALRIGSGGSGYNWNLNGNLTGSGDITYSPVNFAATLALGGDNSGYSGTFTVNGANAAFQWMTASAGSANAAWVLNNTFASGTRMRFSGGWSGTIELGSLSGSGIGLVNNNAGTVTMSIGALNTSTVFSGTITSLGSGGPIGLTKVGTGTLTLSGANSYTGPTLVSTGGLFVSSAKTSTGDFTVSDNATLGVILATSGGSLNMTSLSFGNSTNTYVGLSSTTVPAITNSGTLTLAGTVTVNVQGTFGVGQYPLISSSNGIAGTGNFVIGTLPAGAVATIITNGNVIVLNVTTAPALQVWTGSADGNWNTTTTNWLLTGTPVAYTDTIGALFDDSSTRTNVTIVTNVSPLSLTISNSTRDYAFTNSGGKITGAAAITKIGNSKLSLSGTNDFTGALSINGGTVVVSDNASFGSAAGAIALNGTLQVAQNLTLTRTLSVGPSSGSGNGIINIGTGITVTNNTANGNNSTGTGTLVKTGAGTLQLGGTSSYSGGTVVSNGTLVLTAGGGVGTIRGAVTIQPGTTLSCVGVDALGYNAGQSATPVNINGGILDDASGGNEGFITTFNLMGGRMTNSVATDGTHGFNFNGSSSGLNSLATNIVSIVSGNVVLRAGGLSINTAAGTVPSGIDLTISGIISGSGLGFQKDGAGTLELTGVNTYNGTTTVAGGRLLVDGTGVLPGAVTVNSGATLGGNGQVGGAVSVNASATLAPGTPGAIGTLTLGNNLTLAGDTIVKLNKGLAQSNDVVSVAGTLTYGGTLTVTNIGPVLTAGDTFRIFPTGGTGSLTVSGDAGSGRAFSFADGVVSVVSAGPSGPATITNSVTGNTLNLTWPAGQGWRLQAQTNSLSVGLTTNGWVNVTTTDGSYNATVNPTNATVFFRLVYP